MDDFGLSCLNFLLNPWYFYTVEYCTSYNSRLKRNKTAETQKHRWVSKTQWAKEVEAGNTHCVILFISRSEAGSLIYGELNSGAQAPLALETGMEELSKWWRCSVACLRGGNLGLYICQNLIILYELHPSKTVEKLVSKFYQDTKVKIKWK